MRTSAYVSIRRHTSAYVSIRQIIGALLSAYVSIRGCIRQHTSAYVSIRQHTSAYVSIRQHTSVYVDAYVSIRQHTSCGPATGTTRCTDTATKHTCSLAPSPETRRRRAASLFVRVYQQSKSSENLRLARPGGGARLGALRARPPEESTSRYCRYTGARPLRAPVEQARASCGHHTLHPLLPACPPPRA